MPSVYPLGYDPQGDHWWSRVVDLVDENRDPHRHPQMADRGDDFITWLMEAGDGTETHVTVRERRFIDLPFRRTVGRPGVWGNLSVLRVGLSTLVAFRTDPNTPGPWPELESRPGNPSLAISVQDDVGTWYPQVGPWGSGNEDFGLRFTAPPREARTLKVLQEDRGVLLAEYTAALPLPLRLG